ncbi:hypothetical protein [Streptomyces shenzhenensis]|uniref:hypothetical protein n=1 Tax=Streptomyces shenzhenensis TaxID=943815 RepID=UPI0036C47FE7
MTSRTAVLDTLYGSTEARMRAAASQAGGQAVGAAAQRARQYRSQMIHRDDSWLDGPLTDNRCKARADAATAVGDAYRDELPMAVVEPVADLRKGRPQANATVRSIADDVRGTLTTVLAQSKKALADAHTQSAHGAQDAMATALQAIGQAVASAEDSLAQLQASQTAAVKAQAARQRQAVERSASAASAATGNGAASARRGLDDGLAGFLRILAQDEVPDPHQLDEVLTRTGTQMDGHADSAAQQLRALTGRAAASLGAAAEGAARAMSATAGAAASSARRSAAASGQALGRTATQTASGLRELQQGHARTAQAMRDGHQDACDQVLGGLDKAYTELASQFQQGADGQVQAVAAAFTKAATQDIHPKITEEADKAADKVRPRWQSVLTILIVIVVVIALSIALGPLVIGAVTAGAAALGAGAAASAIGLIVGGAIVGAAAGAVGQVVSNALNGQPLLDGVVKAAVFGAIGGAIGGGASAAALRSGLGTAARVSVEMAVEVVTDVGLGAADAAFSGQAFGWEDVLLSVVTTVAVSGVMAHPRVDAMTARVQAGVSAGLGKIGISVPGAGADVPAPDTTRVPDVGGVEAPSTGAGSTVGTGADGGASAATPQPGRGPDGAISWNPSDIDPTGGAGSADSPVRPRDPGAIATELCTALGPLAGRVDITVDPNLPGRSVRVHYDLDADGLITNVRMVAGASATPADIRLHVPTARTMLRYGGLTGRVRQVLRQAAEWIGIHGAPPVGSRAWEAHLELQKLPKVIADRARAYADADPAARAELEAELASLINQVETHAQTLKDWNLDPGRGYVAADFTGTELAARIEADHPGRLPKLKPPEQFRVGLNSSGDIVRLEHWSSRLGTSAEKLGDYHPETGERLPAPTRKPEPRFPEGLTKEEAFDRLGGNDPGNEFGAFIKLLEDQGLIPDRQTFISGMQEPGGLTHRTVRSNAKDGYIEKLAEKLTHAELLVASKTLGSGDQGSLGEAWYAHHYAQNATPQVTVTPRQAQDSGFTLGTERRIDLLDGNTIREIKNITARNEKKYKEQLQDLVNMIGHEVPVGDGHRSVNGVVYSVLDPTGFRTNADWLLSFLEVNQGLNLQLEVFNASGQRVVIHAASGLDFSLGLGSLSPEGCGGKPLSEWLGDQKAPKGGGG